MQSGDIVKVFYVRKKKADVPEEKKQKVYDDALRLSSWSWIVNRCMGKDAGDFKATIIDSRKFSNNTIEDAQNQHVSVPVWMQLGSVESLNDIKSIEMMDDFVMWTDEALIDQIKSSCSS